jgi:hypothetical protein
MFSQMSQAEDLLSPEIEAALNNAGQSCDGRHAMRASGCT